MSRLKQSSDMSGDIVYKTAVLSLFAQLVITGVTAASYAIDVPDETDAADLTLIVTFELVSQVVEFVWYTVVLLMRRAPRPAARYLDWVWSTPVMLVSFQIFFQHREAREFSTVVPPSDYIVVDARTYLYLVLNALMLAFGLAAEYRDGWCKGVLLIAGGVAFVGSFALLSSFVPGGDEMSLSLFLFVYTVWSLYGVAAAALGPIGRGVAYNGLDIVSKNFYGLFLFVYALTR